MHSSLLILASLFFMACALHGQEVAKLETMIPVSTVGQTVISTRKVPGSPNAKPEVYEVITGQGGGATLTLGALGAVKMEPESKVRVPATAGGHSLEVLKGKLFFDINAAELKKHQNAEFRLKTPAALLAVKGTQFFVESRAGQEVLGVHEGAAAVAVPATRSVVQLGKGQATSVAAASPAQTRPLTADELAQAGVYATMLPTRTPVLALVVSGSSGTAEYLVRGDLATVPKDDTNALTQLGATVLLTTEPADAEPLKLAESGEVQMRPPQKAAPMRLRLTLRQPEALKATALRFYLRSTADWNVTVDGRAIPPAPKAPQSANGGSHAWSDCLLDLRTTAAGGSISFWVEVLPADPKKTTAKASGRGAAAAAPPALELTDFTLLSAPAGAP